MSRQSFSHSARVPLEETSPIGAADAEGGAVGEAGARWIERRISVIWALLFFNGLGSLPGRTILPIPRPIAQGLAFLALLVALVLSIGLNRRLLVRPNVVLGLSTILVAVALTSSIRLIVGPGAVVRTARFGIFLAVLWLLTPWWGSRNLLLLRCHFRALLWVSAIVLLGLAVSPSAALSGGKGGRLISILWYIPAPQVAEYAALGAGLAIVSWLSGTIAPAPAGLIAVTGVGMVLLSHTRTAIVGLVGGVVYAGLTLLLARRRIRRALAILVLVAPLAVVAAAPALSLWFTRGQSGAEIGGLTGRKEVWQMLVAKPRPAFNRWFGFGLSDKSFNGLAIDSTWLAVYQDEGLLGDVLVGGIFLFLLVAPVFRPPGPARAVASFIVVYCCIASYTEVGLGDASAYLLSIVVAASLLAPEAAQEPVAANHG